jgi:hypothetical protein
MPDLNERGGDRVVVAVSSLRAGSSDRVNLPLKRQVRHVVADQGAETGCLRFPFVRIVALLMRGALYCWAVLIVFASGVVVPRREVRT